jgi:hypothetical protein
MAPMLSLRKTCNRRAVGASIPILRDVIDVAVQRSHDADARHHGRPVMLDDREASL